MPPSVVGVNSSGIWPSERAGKIGEKVRLETKRLDHIAQFLEIAWREVTAGKDVYLPGAQDAFRGWLDERLHHPVHGF